MKSQVRNVVENNGKPGYTCLAFICPGCVADGKQGTGLHMLAVNTSHKTPQWDWNGDLEKPTLSPSILTSHMSGPDDANYFRCHSFLVDGVFKFLEDCSHPLKGKNVEMVDLPLWFTQETEEIEKDRQTENGE